MPFYDVRCPECGYGFEIMQGMNDEHVEFGCEMCVAKMTRHLNRDGFDIPLIQGDTVSGGCDYNYFDPHLGREIRGKKDRAMEMERQGLTEYTPDPVTKKYLDEAGYIRKSATPDEKKEAQAAATKELKTAKRKSHRARIDKSFDSFNKKHGGL